MSKKVDEVNKALFNLSEKHAGNILNIVFRMIDKQGASTSRIPNFEELLPRLPRSGRRGAPESKKVKGPSKKQLRALKNGREKLRQVQKLRLPTKGGFKMDQEA